MKEQTLLFSYEGEPLKRMIEEPLHNLIKAIKKYTALPVGILQIVISRMNYQPTLILSAYDDASYLSALSNIDLVLSQGMVQDLPETTTPLISIFPCDFHLEDVIYNTSDRFCYATAFAVNINKFRSFYKIAETNGTALFSKCNIYASSDRSLLSCSLELQPGYTETGLVFLPPGGYVPITLPLTHYIKINPSIKPLIESVMSGKGALYSDPKLIEEIMTAFKTANSYDLGGILIFRDFVKQKPILMMIYTADDVSADGHPIKAVCLKLTFSNKLTHSICYRYLTNIL
jgi:hypothetical protein